MGLAEQSAIKIKGYRRIRKTILRRGPGGIYQNKTAKKILQSTLKAEIETG